MTHPTEIVSPVVPVAERGNLREVGRLAYPVVLSQLSATVMGIVDSALVGRLGATELGAVGFSNIWSWTCFSLFFGTASAVQTFVAQDHGAGREERCGRWAWQAMWVIAPAALLTAAGGLAFRAELLAWLGPSAALQGEAGAYLATRLVGIPGMSVVFVWMSFFRGIGDTRTPLRAAVAANLLNAVLDYGLIFGRLGLPAWGVAGAGAATAAGEWLYALLLLVASRRLAVARVFRTEPAPPQRDEIRRFVRTGGPIGGQWVIDMAAFALFTTLVARMGDASMAASQAFVMLLSLSFMQAVGISVAASTLVGRYVGRRDPAAARRSFDSSLKFAAGLAGTVAALFVAAPEAMMRIFTDDPEVVALGTPLVRLGALFQFLDACAIVSAGALRGAGDTRWPFLVQSALAWGLFLPLAWLLGVALGGGLTPAWVAGTIYVACLGGILLWRFRSGTWEEIRI